MLYRCERTNKLLFDPTNSGAAFRIEPLAAARHFSSLFAGIKLVSSLCVQAESAGSGGSYAHKVSKSDFRAGKHAHKAAADIVHELTSAHSDSPPALRMPIPIRAIPRPVDIPEPPVRLLPLDGADMAVPGHQATAEAQNSGREDVSDSDYMGLYGIWFGVSRLGDASATFLWLVCIMLPSVTKIYLTVVLLVNVKASKRIIILASAEGLG